MLSTSLRTQKLTHAHALLAQRVIALLQHLHLLIPTVRSSAIRPEEEALRTQLDAIEEELIRGGAGRGKMNELWGVVGQLAALQQAGQAPGMNGGPGQDVEWRVVDPEGLETIARVRRLTSRRFLVDCAHARSVIQILSEQQQGLAHLTKLLRNDLRDLAVILENTGGTL